MAASYRMLFADLRTNIVVMEVPVYGVSFSRLISKAADLTVSINLNRTGYNNQDIIDATVPGKTAVYIDRHDGLIWGGILWSRTYQSQATTFQFTGQTFESYAFKHVIETSLSYNKVNQLNILCDLFLKMQQKSNVDIGIQPPAGYPFSGGVLRTVSFDWYDDWTFGKAIDYLVEFEDGLDYSIEVYYDEDGEPRKQLRCADILGSPVENTGQVFDYPGNITNYYWPENASRAAVSVVGTGAGEGTAKLRSKSSDPTLLDAGYPDYQEIYANTDVSVKSTLDSQTVKERVRLRPPITIPTIEVSSDNLSTLALGDYAKVEIQDPRFEAGISTYVRVLGFDGQPPEKDGPETCKLILEGQE